MNIDVELIIDNEEDDAYEFEVGEEGMDIEDDVEKDEEERWLILTICTTL